MRKFLKIGCLVVVSVGLLLALAGAGAIFYFDSQYAFLSPGPEISHESVTSLHPAIHGVLDPAPLAEIARQRASKEYGRDIPPWLVSFAMPRSVSFIAAADHDSGTIPLETLINEKRFGPVFVNFYREFTKDLKESPLGWSSDSLVLERRGLLRLTGGVDMEPQSREAAWYEWTHSADRTALPLEGGHLLEVVADNREGDAYVAASSLMDALDFKLEERASDISFTSFQFVTSMRLTADLDGAGDLNLRLTMEVIPETKDRIAVINLKVALEKSFTSISETWKKDHDLTFEGASEWQDNVVVYNYVLKDFGRFLDLCLDGKIKAN